MEAAYWYAWSQMRGIGPVLLKRIFEYFGSLERAWYSGEQELWQVEGLGKITIASILEQRSLLDPLPLWQKHLQQNPQVWTPVDPHYPQLLWQIPDPPPILYYKGTLQTWSESYTIAIVGTRSPTSYGLRWTEKISTALAERGFVIVSGLAEGIDSCAQRACLKAGGKTIAVVGTGVDRVYPSRHQQLYEQILAQGLVLSEYPQGTPPDRSHFPKRNRIIAGLCRGVIVMEAPEGSGALITAYQANEYQREVFVLPGNLDTKQARGCLQLLQRGAQIILGVDELLAVLGELPLLDPPADASQLPIPEAYRRVVDLIPYSEAISFDRLIALSGLQSGELASQLLELEILGIVIQHPGMRYQRT
ncbi:MAG: DNA-processing protein DprA [Pseudanabaenaceae cyanobacterium SKYGB_i_bin29]|nr:DNA-processing protein DprA [Pseudanabaenaceae cyanobacterium SKYG29]MDW8420659.1 DNA-processing protein DprA [Pseudanabaenaceae cyanobacterium SKYGB_i_bin29]